MQALLIAPQQKLLLRYDIALHNWEFFNLPLIAKKEFLVGKVPSHIT